MQILIKVIQIATYLYVSMFLLRFFLQLVKADFYNPISQFLIKFTNILVLPLRKIIPSILKTDTASILAGYLLLMLSTVLIHLLENNLLSIGYSIIGYILLISLQSFVIIILNIYFYAIVLQAIGSWFATSGNISPMMVILMKLVNPIISPVRKIVPLIAGRMDLSGMIVLIIILIIINFIESILIVF